MKIYSVIAVVTAALLAAGCGETVALVTPPPAGRPPSLESPWETVVVTGSVVNLRQGPGTQYAVVGSASAGDTLMVTGEAPGWYRIYAPERSLFAWIYSTLTTGADMPR